MADLNPTEAVPKDGVQFGAFKILTLKSPN